MLDLSSQNTVCGIVLHILLVKKFSKLQNIWYIYSYLIRIYFVVKCSFQSLKLKHGVRYWTNFLTFSFFINCDSFKVTTELIEKKNVYLQQLKELLPEALPSSSEVISSKRSKGLSQELDLWGILYPYLALTKTGIYHSSCNSDMHKLTIQNFSGISTFASAGAQFFFFILLYSS